MATECCRGRGRLHAFKEDRECGVAQTDSPEEIFTAVDQRRKKGAAADLYCKGRRRLRGLIAVHTGTATSAMDPVLSIMLLSVILGAVIALAFFGNYFSKRRSEVVSVANTDLQPDQKKQSRPPRGASKKAHPKSHSHAADKDQNKRHHPLDVNTLKGHADAVTGLCFSSDGRSLATACADSVIRVFKLDDASNKSFKFLRINLPAGGHPTAVAFADDASSIVVASQAFSGSSIYMYGEEKPKTTTGDKQQTKLPLPEIKWEHHKVHDKRAILTLSGATASYGTADGSTVIASCSE
ncbi:hypothetical protein CRG98_001863, partial [Punica granatum]